MSKSSTSFSSDIQPKERKPRGKSVRTKILEAMKREGKTEEGFYDLLVQKAFEDDNNFHFSELLKRFSPIPKQVAPMVEFDFDKSLTPAKQAGQVLDAISSGVIPPDVGSMIISSIKSMLDIEEVTELKERLEAIEKQLGINE